jgi:hypothetical protein
MLGGLWGEKWGENAEGFLGLWKLITHGTLNVGLAYLNYLVMELVGPLSIGFSLNMLYLSASLFSC